MAATLPVKEGYADFSAPAAGKPCKTWYKVVGDLSSGVTPLVSAASTTPACSVL